MLLAVDVGNTQTVLGLYEGEELRDHWRIATEAHRSGDELGALLDALLPGLERIDGVCLSSTVPALVRSYEDFVARFTSARLLVLGPGVRTGVPVRYGRSARGRAGPDRQRRRGQGALRRACDRRRLRHLDELRRRVGGGRVARRRARPRDRDLDGCPLRAGREAVQGRVHRAADGDRQDDRRVAAVGSRLRLRRAGGRDRHAHPGGARRGGAGDRHGRPGRADRAAFTHDRARRSRGSRSTGCGSSGI